jgi:lipoprotein-anchoring transpeptidase ErfK/SrfK
MSRSSTSLLFRTGLLLATALVTISPRLGAETTAPQNLPSSPQTSVAPNPKTSPTPGSVPIKTGNDRQPQTPPKLDTGSSPTGTNSSTPSKPVTTNNSTPAVRPQPAANPAAKPGVTSSTSKPPVLNVVNLVLKLNEKRVYVYKGDKLVAKYPVAIGKKGWETPTGEWYVMEKIKNPGWTSFKTGEVFSPGQENPLGSRWIGFWTDGQDVIGFHGTPDLKSIGTAASHGCVRMYNKDVKALFPIVKVGTIVKVVNE